MTSFASPETNAELAAAWGALADRIKAFGESTMTRGDALDQAEGLRHTLRFLGHLADYHTEHTDPLRPYFWRAITGIRKYYGDGVDVDYDSCRIDGAHTYRISGTTGTVPYLAFIVNKRGAGDRYGGNIVIGPEHLREDGAFEVWLSPELGDRPGIQLDDKCVEVVARQYHKDRASEVPAEFTIERLGEPVEPRAPLDPGVLASALGRIGHGLDISLQRLDVLADRLSQKPNEVSNLTANEGAEFFGTTSNQYQLGWWDLADDEVLEITFKPADAVYFGVQLFNRWFESLEFRDHVTSLNDSQITPEPNGDLVVRIGEAKCLVNRLDPCGHRSGMIAVRLLEGVTELPAPTVRVIKA